jgi:hypothetical protein
LPLPVEECVNIPASLKVISEIYLRDTDIDLLRTNVDRIPESVIVDGMIYPSEVMITGLVQAIIDDADCFSALGYEFIEARMRTTVGRIVDTVGLMLRLVILGLVETKGDEIHWLVPDRRAAKLVLP